MSTPQGIRERIRNGHITTLLAFQTSALILMDYSDEQTTTLLSLGLFSINLALHLNCLILAFCCVDGFMWPLARDTLVVRISKRTFVFALPGLLYGLQFPMSCQEKFINAFVEAFIQFGHYMDISNNGPAGILVEDNEPNIWKKVRPNIEALAHETLKKLGHLPGRSRFFLPNHNSCRIRAIRMSDATKTVLKSMETGTFTNTFVKFNNPSSNAHDEDSAYASVRVFCVLVDCLEIYCLNALGHVLNEPPLLECYIDTHFKLWEFSRDGFLAFACCLRSSVAANHGIKELLNVSIKPFIRKGKRTLRSRRVNWEKILHYIKVNIKPFITKGKGKRSLRSPRVNWEENSNYIKVGIIKPFTKGKRSLRSPRVNWN